MLKKKTNVTRLISLSLIFTLLSSLLFLPTASAAEIREYDIDLIELPVQTISNGEVALWDNNSKGYLIPKGSCLSYEVNANLKCTIELVVYKMNSNGEFVLHISYLTDAGNLGMQLDNGYVQETGYYKFGVRSYALNDIQVSGYLYYSS